MKGDGRLEKAESIIGMRWVSKPVVCRTQGERNRSASLGEPIETVPKARFSERFKPPLPLTNHTRLSANIPPVNHPSVAQSNLDLHRSECDREKPTLPQSNIPIDKAKTDPQKGKLTYTYAHHTHKQHQHQHPSQQQHQYTPQESTNECSTYKNNIDPVMRRKQNEATKREEITSFEVHPKNILNLYVGIAHTQRVIKLYIPACSNIELNFWYGNNEIHLVLPIKDLKYCRYYLASPPYLLELEPNLVVADEVSDKKAYEHMCEHQFDLQGGRHYRGILIEFMTRHDAKALLAFITSPLVQKSLEKDCIISMTNAEAMKLQRDRCNESDPDPIGLLAKSISVPPQVTLDCTRKRQYSPVSPLKSMEPPIETEINSMKPKLQPETIHLSDDDEQDGTEYCGQNTDGTYDGVLGVDQLCGDNHILVYPPGQLDAVPLITADLERLQTDEYLNDSLLEFYLKYVWYEKMTSDQRHKYHIFSPFFYHRLTDKINMPQRKVDRWRAHPGYSKVQRWTSRINIFEKDVLFVPINEKSHWYLVGIFYPGDISIDKNNVDPDHVDSDTPTPTSSIDSRAGIVVFDSLGQGGKSHVLRHLRWYLESEWHNRHPLQPRKCFNYATMPMTYAKVPQQDNYCDCGLFLLQYIETFMENPVVAIRVGGRLRPTVDLPMWFPQSLISYKRKHILDLILDLRERAKSDASFNFKKISDMQREKDETVIGKRVDQLLINDKMNKSDNEEDIVIGNSDNNNSSSDGEKEKVIGLDGLDNTGLPLDSIRLMTATPDPYAPTPSLTSPQARFAPSSSLYSLVPGNTQTMLTKVPNNMRSTPSPTHSPTHDSSEICMNADDMKSALVQDRDPEAYKGSSDDGSDIEMMDLPPDQTVILVPDSPTLVRQTSEGGSNLFDI